jgi:spore coat protein H
MPAQESLPLKPWKVLLAALIVSAVGWSLLAPAFSELSRRSGNQERRVERPMPTAQRNRGPRGGMPRLMAEQSESTLAEANSATPRTFAKNAILASKAKDGTALIGDDIFKDAFIPTLKIEIPREGTSGLERRPRTYVRATIREGATTYTNVAIRLKGGPGSFRNFDDNPAFTINFEHFAKGQTFHGLKKIHLNNSVQDNGYLSEKISRELFEAAGVPAPRAGNAMASVNGKDARMYVLIEGINKQFLKRYFKDTKGNVYDGHSGTDVTDDLPTNDGENPKDKSRLRALAAAVRQPDLEARMAALEKTLDVDRFLSFVAIEMMLCHWDGYTIGRNNFRIFHDRDSDRMVFMPQGVDQILGKPFGQVFPAGAGGMVVRAVLEIPEGRRRYRERVAQLTTNVFDSEAICDRVHEVSQKIEAALAQIDSRWAQEHRNQAAGFCRRIQQRASYLHNQISSAKPIKFDEMAMTSLTDWEEKRDLGEAELTKEQDEHGNTLLRISTKEGCTASWRTTRMLDPGKYRFEARIKTRGVVFPENDPRAGAGLRISRHRVGQKNSGDKDWTPVSFEFQVPQDQSGVELVCELRANKGDVWFELKSLRLKREQP